MLCRYVFIGTVLSVLRVALVCMRWVISSDLHFGFDIPGNVTVLVCYIIFYVFGTSVETCEMIMQHSISINGTHNDVIASFMHILSN